MDKKKKKREAFALSLAMATMLSLPVGVSAQNGLFQRGASTETMRETEAGMFSQRNEASGVINNQTFGQPVPVGSGIIVLLVAGVGYSVLKRKEDEQ